MSEFKDNGPPIGVTRDTCFVSIRESPCLDGDYTLYLQRFWLPHAIVLDFCFVGLMAQWKSVPFTPERSLVRSQLRPRCPGLY